MLRGFGPALYACALMLALNPDAVLAQAGEPAAITPATPTDPATPSAAEDNEARELFKIGKEAFDEARYERALKYFKDAHDLSHRPALLSNIGTALDRLRRDQEALDAYRKYLEQVPEAPNRPLVEERIRIIEAALARSSAAPPPTAAALVSPSEAPAPAAAPTPQQAALAAPGTSQDNQANRLTDSGTTPVTSRWWFWTGIGAVAVAAVIVVVAVSASGSSNNNAKPQSPTLLDPTTRVREL